MVIKDVTLDKVVSMMNIFLIGSHKINNLFFIKCVCCKKLTRTYDL
jgi:hypothetical protein